MKLPILRTPDANWSDDNASNVYIAHCDNIAHILANTVFLWKAKRKIRRYLALTGALVK